MLIAVILLLAMTGCGTVHAGESGASPSPALSLWRGWGFSGDQIVSVSVEHSGRVLDTAATFAPTSTALMRRCSDFRGACTVPSAPPP